ncbi:cytochrome c biogenesis protein : 1-aminocyclopropane-1-carboxylate deaminase OS=Thermomicrobium roseum (strain ATCC 27502 / DSM 5159 / P-2) GN=trd_1612 PE=4 SV=1: PALP [Gemmata massiliana]|uniref:Tryptophan synthase beta chain-like PALP domain-containing protein n=1 Tax=Gemmata massiliana TaxID=1210884 RepID=A0A6P2D078_9BACT|nr:pyridoxal-phosphate dependent enzyme [Gemmata massiliana]VTR94651.1 cytochrome c biogenesis protein : 1-aminocyclopropane-1-carboxylate deaminase OS=Thermomicrobium roseum (strain ATCC 27502 / DSM 5159 / P-2) GN=trd_1612 PE=4 SV=1: PALP [Gemmata massiliana]
MPVPTLTPAEVRAAAAQLPRERLAHLPTPLEEMPRFAAKIGGGVRIFIKRDDCTGLVLGGNKARHNEFLLGDAVASGADMFVWGALVQSNNCRQTAASCAKLGLECRLYLSKAHQKTEPQGNLLLDYLVGAHVEFTDAKIGPELNALLASKAEEFRRAGRNPYFWNPPRVVPLAAVSYALCMAEIAEQLTALNVNPAAFYVSSAGATGAGVALGKALLGFQCPARLICPMPWPWHIPTRMAEDANAAAERLGLPHRLAPEDLDADESFIAPGYGLPSRAGQEAMHLLATTEAILTDHVYTAKALAALIADVRAGKYSRGSSVVFIHTGGVPAIFAEPDKVLPGM